MSALLCCGRVFDAQMLVKGRDLYRWMENMLCSQEEKVSKRAHMHQQVTEMIVF